MMSGDEFFGDEITSGETVFTCPRCEGPEDECDCEARAEAIVEARLAARELEAARGAELAAFVAALGRVLDVTFPADGTGQIENLVTGKFGVAKVRP